MPCQKDIAKRKRKGFMSLGENKNKNYIVNHGEEVSLMSGDQLTI
jgi:hypothetical protein